MNVSTRTCFFLSRHVDNILTCDYPSPRCQFPIGDYQVLLDSHPQCGRNDCSVSNNRTLEENKGVDEGDVFTIEPRVENEIVSGLYMNQMWPKTCSAPRPKYQSG